MPDEKPSISFNTYATHKLHFLLRAEPEEVGGFLNLCPDALAQNRLLVRDITLVKHYGSTAHFNFDDAAMADYFIRVHEMPGGFQCNAIINFHTHPGNSASPSSDDENRLWKQMGTGRHFHGMFIAARDMSATCRIGYQATVPPQFAGLFAGAGLTAINYPVKYNWYSGPLNIDPAVWREELAATHFPLSDDPDYRPTQTTHNWTGQNNWNQYWDNKDPKETNDTPRPKATNLLSKPADNSIVVGSWDTSDFFRHVETAPDARRAIAIAVQAVEEQLPNHYYFKDLKPLCEENSIEPVTIVAYFEYVRNQRCKHVLPLEDQKWFDREMEALRKGGTVAQYSEMEES